MSLPETLKQIDQLKKEADALQPLKPGDEQRLWKKFRLEWNYNSNHIEGNTLTYGETELLLIFDKTTGDHDKREYDEMQAHDVAIKMVQELAAEGERPLTESFIRKVNEIILVKPYWKEAETRDGQRTRREIRIGEYKSFPNSVRLQNGEMFHYATPEETPALMHDLMKWYNENSNLHPVELAALFHYKFVRIHPFDDGNGRVARLVMNYILLKAGYPPAIIKSKDKANYLTALNKADVGDIQSFINYIAEELIWSLTILNRAAKGESIDELGDVDKEIILLKRTLIKDNILSIHATADQIVQVIHENIFPLFMMIEEKCAQLKELFFDFDRKIIYQIKGEQIEQSLGTKKSTWDSLRSNWLHNQIRKGNKVLSLLKYDYELKGFKKTIEAHNFYIHVEVFFNEYNYIIEVRHNPIKPTTIPYGKMLTEEELASIYTPMLKEVIENIKRLNSSK